MLFFTGFSRLSSEIQKNTASNLEKKTSELKDMLYLVDEAEKILVDEKQDINEFGRLLDLTWQLKRRIGDKISTDSIDELYRKALNAGAMGGKILGAGGGGFLLFYVEKNRQEKVKEVLRDLLYVPFRFENGGTRVVHYTPELYDNV